MGQSLTAIYIHAIFSTKFSVHYIDPAIEPKLHAYMSGILKRLNSPALNINSMPEHIHILFRMSKNHSIANIMEIVKKDSSKWMKTQGCSNFKWQIGYAAYSVSQSGVKTVSNYIKNQKIHHKKISFVKEIETLMDKYEVDEYSREYFWT